MENKTIFYDVDLMEQFIKDFDDGYYDDCFKTKSGDLK